MGAVVALLLITSTSRLLKLLKGDKKAIFRAAARASEAARYILAFSRTEVAHAEAA